jgi:hypothetical protein
MNYLRGTKKEMKVMSNPKASVKKTKGKALRHRMTVRINSC